MEWGGTATHEIPRDSEDGTDDGHANEDVLLVAAVEIVFHPRSESSSSSSSYASAVDAAAAAAFSCHFPPPPGLSLPAALRFWSLSRAVQKDPKATAGPEILFWSPTAFDSSHSGGPMGSNSSDPDFQVGIPYWSRCKRKPSNQTVVYNPVLTVGLLLLK